METSLGTLRFVQAQKKISRWKNITIDAEGDADMFLCDLLFENFFAKPQTKGLRTGRTSRTSGTRGCDRPKLWQVYGKLVCFELNALNAPKVLGKLPALTSWAYYWVTSSARWEMPDWTGVLVWVMLFNL